MFGKARAEPERRDGLYMAIVRLAVRHPLVTLVIALAMLVAVPWAYARYGAGVEFFPNVEPEYGLLYVHARGNLSLEEMDRATAEAETRILGWPGVKSVYTRGPASRAAAATTSPRTWSASSSTSSSTGASASPRMRCSTRLRQAMAGIPGVDVEVQVPQAGPPTGKAIQVRLSAADPTGLDLKARRKWRRCCATIPGVIDVSDGLPPPGVDWALDVDRSKAAQYGIVRLRRRHRGATRHQRPEARRNTGRPESTTPSISACACPRTGAPSPPSTSCGSRPSDGSVPISNFVSRKPERTVGILNRIDGERTIVVQANVAQRGAAGGRASGRRCGHGGMARRSTASAGSSPARTRNRRRRRTSSARLSPPRSS